jgi:glycerol dehydrogenase-like iron-containing ADH family enzyme
MELHTLDLPRKILMGNGVSGQTLELCRELKLIGSPLVLADEGTRKIAGDRVFHDL